MPKITGKNREKDARPPKFIIVIADASIFRKYRC
jgi:hypothetical protein